MSHIFQKHWQSSRKSDLLNLLFAIFIDVYTEFLLLTCPLPCFTLTPISPLSSPTGLFFQIRLLLLWDPMDLTKNSVLVTVGLQVWAGAGDLTSGYTASAMISPSQKLSVATSQGLVQCGGEELKSFP